MSNPWPLIAALYATGVMAAAQLGQLSALLPQLQDELTLSLTAAAALVSFLELGGATLGLMAGVVVRRVGLNRALLAGLALMVLACIGLAAAQSAPLAFLWRAIQAAAYLTIVVAAPTLIATISGPDRQPTALALWSTFFPVGFAIGSVLAGALAAPFGWRGALLAIMLPTALLLLPALRLPAISLPRAGSHAHPLRAPAAAWLTALAFCFYTVFEVGVLAVLPTYLAEAHGLSAGSAGAVAGIAAVATVLGGLYAAAWLRASRPTGELMAAALIGPALLLFLAFTPAAWSVTWIWPATAAILLNAISGVVPAIVFARLPQLLGSGGDMATANGLLAQGGASGSLLGPPLLAGAASSWGWPAAAAVGFVASLLSLAAAMGGGRRQPPLIAVSTVTSAPSCSSVSREARRPPT